MDNAIVNISLAKRGNIDAQIDAHKAAEAKFAKEENKQVLRNGVLHLFRGKFPKTFANRTQAEKAAARTGGEAYQSPQSRVFLVRFVA